MVQKGLLDLANSLGKICYLYLGSVLASALLFAWAEDRTFLDGLWWSSATALTIGYGDIAPVTVIGKLIGLVFAHVWVLITIPLVVANIIVNIVEDKEKFTQAEQDEVKGNLRKVLSILEKK